MDEPDEPDPNDPNDYIWLCGECGAQLSQIDARPGKEEWICKAALEEKMRLGWRIMSVGAGTHRNAVVYALKQRL